MRRAAFFIALFTSTHTAAFARPVVDPAADRHETGDGQREVGVPKVVGVGTVEGPMGKVGTGRDGNLGDVLGPRMRMAVDVGVPVSATWRLSGRGALLLGSAGQALDTLCDAGREAADSDDSRSTPHPTCISYGLSLEAHLRHDFRTDVPVGAALPWISFGVGAEQSWLKASSGQSDRVIGSFEGSFTGIHLAMPAVGVDWHLDDRYIFGVFVHASIGRYLHRTGTLDMALASPVDADYGGPSTHAWLGGGFQVGRF